MQFVATKNVAPKFVRCTRLLATSLHCFYAILQSTCLIVNSLTGGSWISFRYVPNYNKAILQKRGTGM